MKLTLEFMYHTEADLIVFIIPGYLLTIALETPVLLLLLSRRHSLRDRLAAGVLLTAFTYPIVVFVLPILLERPFGYRAYIAIAETFAPTAECALFYFYWIRPRAEAKEVMPMLQDFAAIVIANLVSWLIGGVIGNWLM